MVRSVPWRFRVVAVVTLVAFLAACTAPSNTSGHTSTSATETTRGARTTTIPAITKRVYMTDRIEFLSVPPGVDQVSTSVKVVTRRCSDYDSCLNGMRRSDGYVWFSALAVDLGASPTDPNYYGMHGGLAMGGSGHQSQLYLDWSGYCPASLGGEALRDGGSACASANSKPTFKPHTAVGFQQGHWYRLTVRKTACADSDVTDVTGPLTGWQMIATDEVTSIEQSGGTWCLPNAPVIADASFFQEIIEQRGPCETDFGSAQLKDPQYHVASGWSMFDHASGHYNGNETPVDADCANANIRLVGPHHNNDERMTDKGSHRGITGPGFQTLY